MEKTFSEAFIEHLEASGRKVTEIATASGVHKDSLYALKRGNTRNMSVDLAIKVAAAFGETVEEFMGLEDPHVAVGHLHGLIDQLSDQERAIFSASLKAVLDTRAAQPEQDPDE